MRTLVVGTVIALLLSIDLHAEGSAETGSSQGLSSSTLLHIDVLDAGTETIAWTGTGDITVIDPDGIELGSFNNVFSPRIEGTHDVHLDANQFDGPFSAPTKIHEWDLTILDGDENPVPGRVSSLYWNLTTGSFGAVEATSMSLYAVVQGGAPEHLPVVEVRFDGMSGSAYFTFANRGGPRNGLSGQGVWKSTRTESNGTFAINSEFPLYLNPPERATYSHLSPNTADLSLEACEFSISTDVEGVAQVLCDLDSDGIGLSMTDPDDMRVAYPVDPGVNTFEFGGTDILGNMVPPGLYDCRLIITIGTFHHVGVDMETSHPGIRLFEVEAGPSIVALPMYWDDSLVQNDGGGTPRTVAMPTCGTSPETSPGTGVSSGASVDPTLPFSSACPAGNARAWGDFTGAGKGDAALMDTYTWLSSRLSDSKLQIEPSCFPDDVFLSGFEGEGGKE